MESEREDMANHLVSNHCEHSSAGRNSSFGCILFWSFLCMVSIGQLCSHSADDHSALQHVMYVTVQLVANGSESGSFYPEYTGIVVEQLDIMDCRLTTVEY